MSESKSPCHVTQDNSGYLDVEELKPFIHELLSAKDWFQHLPENEVGTLVWCRVVWCGVVWCGGRGGYISVGLGMYS